MGNVTQLEKSRLLKDRKDSNNSSPK